MAHTHANKHRGWIGVDFDGTLAQYDTWIAPEHCGLPIGAMLFRVKKWLADGREVRIFTARVYPITDLVTDESINEIRAQARELGTQRPLDAVAAAEAIRAWCREHIGAVLPITCVKDFAMVELWDDRAVQVRANTGEIVGHSTRGLA